MHTHRLGRFLLLTGFLSALVVSTIFLLTVTTAAEFPVTESRVWPPRTETEWCDELAPIFKAKSGDNPGEGLWDNTRCDLYTDTYAFEVDRAPKYAEALGQATRYAIALHRKPAIILLADLPQDERYVYRCESICAYWKVPLSVVNINRDYLLGRLERGEKLLYPDLRIPPEDK
jgi:hypothetical protein